MDVVGREEAEQNYAQAESVINELVNLLSLAGNQDPVYQTHVLVKYFTFDHDEANFLVAVAATMINRIRTLEGS